MIKFYKINLKQVLVDDIDDDCIDDDEITYQILSSKELSIDSKAIEKDLERIKENNIIRNLKQQKKYNFSLEELKTERDGFYYINDEVADLDIVISINKGLFYSAIENNNSYRNSLPLIIETIITDLQTTAFMQVDIDDQYASKYNFDLTGLYLRTNLYSILSEDVNRIKLKRKDTIAK